MVLRQHKRDFIFFEQRRHIERHYGRTPSAVVRQRLGPKTSIRFGELEGLSRWPAKGPEIGVSRRL